MERIVKRYLIEGLEPRLLLAAVSWDGGGDGTSYHDPLNWDTDIVPGIMDDVTIDIAANPTISYSASTGNRSVNSLVCREAVNFLTGNSFTIVTTVELDATWSCGAGTLIGGTWDVSGGMLTMDGGGAGNVRIFTNVTVLGEIRALSSGALVFNGGSFDTLLLFAGVSIFLGDGTTVTGDIISQVSGGVTGHVIRAASPTATATFATTCEILVTPGSTANLEINVGDSNALTLINHGTISCQDPGRVIRIGDAGMPLFTNNGTVEVTAGTLTLGAPSWSNTGNVVASGTSTLNVGGGVATGNLNLPGWSIAATATVYLTGALNNAAATLALAPNTGNWRLLGGSIVGGSITYTGGASLRIGGNVNNRLTNVNVIGNLFMDENGGLVRLGLGTRFTNIRITGGNGNRIGFEAGYVLEDDILVQGAGFCDLQMATSGMLTIAATGSVRAISGGPVSIGTAGSGYEGVMSLVNQGLISAENAIFGSTVVVPAAFFTNQGTVQSAAAAAGLEITTPSWSNAAAGTISAAGGTVALRSSWTNAGTIAAAGASSILNLAGVFATSTINLAGFTVSGGATVNITGTLTNTAQTFTLTSATGSWRLHGGTINGGTLSFTGGSELMVTANDGFLNGVTLGAGTLVLSDGALAVVTSGLTVNGTISTSSIGTQTGLSFFGTQALGGTGSIVFNGTSSNNTVRPGVDGNTLTIGTNVTIRTGTQGGEVGFVSFERSVVNNGTLSAETAGRTLTVTGDTVTNNGILQASNGGTLTVVVTPTNFAGGTLTGGTWRALAGSTLRAAGVNITTNAATIGLNGADSNFYNATTGTISALAGLPSNTGTLTLANGRLFDFAPAGNLFVNSGAFTVTGTPGVVIPAPITFEHSGLIDGDGNLTFAGTLEWTGGSMGGSGQTIVANGATAMLAGTAARAGPLTLSRALENLGTTAWAGSGDLVLNVTGAILNAGTFLIQNNATLAGNGSVQNTGTIQKTSAGTSTISTAVSLSNEQGTLRIDAGTLAINGSFQTPAGSITTVVGPGTLELNGTQNWGTGSRMDVNGSCTINLNTDAGTSNRPEIRINSGTVHINASQHFGPYRAISRKGRAIMASGTSQAIVAPGANISVVTDAINLDVPGGAALDLNDGALIVDYAAEDPSPFATIHGYLIAGYNNGTWNGAGIKSTVAAGNPMRKLGYADAADLGVTSFAGEPIDATTVLVKYTIAGDADLDGDVDVADLGRLASNWQASGSWSSGDFNYDDFVDIADLGILASNWQNTLGSAAPVGDAEPRTRVSVGPSKPRNGSLVAGVKLTSASGAVAELQELS